MTSPVMIVADAHSRLKHRQHSTRSEPIRQPAADDLHPGVGIGECGKDEPELNRRQAELVPQGRCGHRDVHPIDVGDEIHQAQQEQHRVPDSQCGSDRYHSTSTPIGRQQCPRVEGERRSRECTYEVYVRETVVSANGWLVSDWRRIDRTRVV